MSAYPLPLNEDERLKALASYHIFDTAEEKDFDALTALASAICGIPIALITFIDADRQAFKSHHGTDYTENTRALSFCTHALVSDEIMIVPDATRDTRFADNPMVTGPTQVVFYAGVPIVNQEGYALGTLCVIDQKTHELSDQQIEALKTLAAQVMDKLELRRKARLLEQREERFRNMVKSAKVGMTILQGTDLIVEIANQPMLTIWGRTETDMMGKPLLEVFPELHDQPFPKMLADIFKSGQAIAISEIPVDITDVSGNSRKIFVDFSYEPLFDTLNQVEAIMATVTDITPLVEARQLVEQNQEELEAMNEELTAANEELQAASEEQAVIYEQLQTLQAASELERERLNQFLMQAPVGVCVLEGPKLIYTLVNPGYQALLPNRNLQDRPIFEALPELVDTPIEKLLLDVYNDGKSFNMQEVLVPLAKIADGPLLDRYFTFDYVPWKNINADVMGVLAFVHEVTDQVQANYIIQQLNEDMAAGNEELKALNEELTATNEELNESNNELSRLQQKASESEAVLRLAISAANFGTWHIDVHTRELMASPRLKELFGFYPDEEVTVASCIAQITDDYRDFVAEEIEKAITQGGNYDLKYTVKGFRDHKLRWLRAVGNLSVNEHGDFTAFTGVIMDITEQKADEQRKSDFIGMVSHELKTPLTSLQGFVQIMQLMAKKAEQPLLLANLEKSATQIKRMSKLVTGFLDVGRYESGQIPLQIESFNIVDLIREMVAEAELSTTSHQLVCEPCEGDLNIHADRNKISQVLINLLSNAIKYSPGGKSITTGYTTANGQITISIKDQGMGIPANHIDKLFDRYYRVDGDHMRNTSGFGIGLYLSAEIVKRHGGKIWVESEYGNGSTFYFSLPIDIK